MEALASKWRPLRTKMSTQTYKIVVLGEPAVGKTTWIKKVCANEFIKNYYPTMGVQVDSVIIGNIEVQMWDCAGIDRFRSTDSKYWQGADAAIIMFDSTRLETFYNAYRWYNDVFKYGSHVPIIFVANKIERTHPAELPSDVNSGKLLYTDCVKISSRTGYNLYDPILSVLSIYNGA